MQGHKIGHFPTPPLPVSLPRRLIPVSTGRAVRGLVWDCDHPRWNSGAPRWEGDMFREKEQGNRVDAFIALCIQN